MPGNLQDTLDDGIQAQHELTLVEKHIEAMKKELVNAFTSCKPSMDQERRNFSQALQICDHVLECLKLNINKSKLAKNKIKDIQRVGKVSLLERVLP